MAYTEISILPIPYLPQRPHIENQLIQMQGSPQTGMLTESKNLLIGLSDRIATVRNDMLQGHPITEQHRETVQQLIGFCFPPEAYNITDATQKEQYYQSQETVLGVFAGTSLNRNTQPIDPTELGNVIDQLNKITIDTNQEPMNLREALTMFIQSPSAGTTKLTSGETSYTRNHIGRALTHVRMPITAPTEAHASVIKAIQKQEEEVTQISPVVIIDDSKKERISATPTQRTKEAESRQLKLERSQEKHGSTTRRLDPDTTKGNVNLADLVTSTPKKEKGPAIPSKFIDAYYRLLQTRFIGSVSTVITQSGRQRKDYWSLVDQNGKRTVSFSDTYTNGFWDERSIDVDQLTHIVIKQNPQQPNEWYTAVSEVPPGKITLETRAARQEELAGIRPIVHLVNACVEAADRRELVLHPSPTLETIKK